MYVNPDPAATLNDPNNTTVPAASGNVIVLSAVGLVTVRDVSKSFALDPSKTIFPLAIFIEFAASADPEISVVPTNVVEVKEDKPVKVVAVPPRLIEVDPIVTAELARLLLAIEDALVNIVPVSFGNVRVLSPPVASAAVNIVSLVSAVDPSNVIFPLAIDIALAASAIPEINVVDANDVKPAIVEAVAPSATAVLPIVRDELANCPLGIALVPNSPVPEL